MIAIPDDREDALDILWAALKNEDDAWRKIFPDTGGTSRARLVEITGWSYSTVYRLVNLLIEREQVAVKWNHQHQSYWEGLFRPINPKELTND